MAGPSVTIEMSADEFKILRSLQKVIDKNREMDKSLKDVEKTGDDAGRKVGKAAEDAGSAIEKATKSATDWAVGLGKVGLAVGAVKALMGAMRDEAAEAVKVTEQLLSERLKLATVTGNPADYSASIDRANEVAARYGLDMGESARILFAAKSAGFESHYETVARAAAIGEGQGAELMATKINTQYPGITPTQAVDAMFAASALTDASPSAIGLEAPGMIPKLRPNTGASLAESLVALGLASKSSGSTAEGSTTIEAFGSALQDNPEFHRLGLIASMRRLRGMSPDELSGVLGGSSEARTGFNTLNEQFDALVENVTKVDEAIRLSGTPASALSIAESNALTDFRTGPILRQRMAENRRNALLEQQSARTIDAKGRLAEFQAYQMENRPWVNRMVGNLLSRGVADYIDPAYAPEAQLAGDLVMQNQPGTGMSRPWEVPVAAYGYMSESGRRGRFGEGVQEGQRLIDGMVDRLMTRFQMKGPSTLASPDVDR